ncbi:MAG: right-handed parallel beta-helix repeat-containing protein [bacterium]
MKSKAIASRKAQFLLASCLIFSLCAHPFVKAAEYYVDSNLGDNSYDGLGATVDSGHGPWKDVSHAGKQVNAGDTVFVRGGTYLNDYFWPLNSGTKDNPITLQAYPDEVPRFTGSGYYDAFINIGWSGNNYFIIDGLDFEDTTGANCILLGGAAYTIIRNCHFKNHSGTMINVNISHHNTIEKNHFETTGDPADYGSGDHIYLLGSDYNLIQNNYFTKAGHAAIDLIDYTSTEFSEYNIIRNNTIEQHWGSGIGLIRGSSHNLVEGNKIFFIGEEVLSYPKSGIMVVANDNIVRHNLIVETSAGPQRDNALTFEGYIFSGISQNSIHNSVYNNVIYKSGKEPLFITQRHDCSVTRNSFFNNILYHNRVGGPYEEYLPDGNYYIIFETYHAYADNKWSSFPNDNYFHHNIILHADAQGDYPGEDPLIYYGQDEWGHSLEWVESNFPDYFHHNLEIPPNFVDPDNYDFHLRPESGAIDTGGFPTKTKHSGNAVTTITVEDSSFFCDGFGIIDGDLIKVSSEEPVRITGVDYEAHALTVDASISFQEGSPVSLSYSGTAPDIGAFEYGDTSLLQGDVNGDGRVDVQDIQACVNHILGIQDWGSSADVDKDGNVDVRDIQKIVNESLIS